MIKKYMANPEEEEINDQSNNDTLSEISSEEEYEPFEDDEIRKYFYNKCSSCVGDCYKAHPILKRLQDVVNVALEMELERMDNEYVKGEYVKYWDEQLHQCQLTIANYTMLKTLANS
jgi:hypothetical protein